MAKIRVLSGSSQGLEVTLGAGMIFGRADTCDIQLQDPRVGRRHAEIIKVDEAWGIRDLKSHNGTFVNETEVTASALRDGDRIRIVDEVMVFLGEEGPAHEFQAGNPAMTMIDDGTAPVRAAVRAEEQKAAAAVAAWPDREQMLRAVEAIETMSKSFHVAKTPEELFTGLEQTFMETYTECDCCQVLVWDAGLKQLLPRRASTRLGEGQQNAGLSLTAARKAIDDQQAFVCVNTKADDAFAASESIATLGIKSFACTPILREGKTFGVIYSDSRRSFSAFCEADLRTLSVIANEAALALNNMELLKHYVEKKRMEVGLQMARDIQSSVLPREAPQIEGFDVAGRCISCDETSGDYFDFIELPDGKWGFAVGDVCGHGVGPALLMMEARSLLRALATSHRDMQQALTRMDQLMGQDVQDGMFMSLFYAVLDPGASSFDYISAGHEPGILFRASSGEIETLGATTCAIAVMPELEMAEPRTAKMGHGDVLFLCTDGIAESTRAGDEQEMFGRARLAAAITNAAQEPAIAIMDAVLAEVNKFTGDVSHRDDLTMVVVKAV